MFKRQTKFKGLLVLICLLLIFYFFKIYKVQDKLFLVRKIASFEEIRVNDNILYYRSMGNNKTITSGRIIGAEEMSGKNLLYVVGCPEPTNGNEICYSSMTANDIKILGYPVVDSSQSVNKNNANLRINAPSRNDILGKIIFCFRNCSN